MNIIETYGEDMRIVEYPERKNYEKCEVQKYHKYFKNGEWVTDWDILTIGNFLQCYLYIVNPRLLFCGED